MEDKQDLFEKLIQITDSYEPDPDLAKRVIEKINQREATVTFKEPVPKWFWVALSCILAVTLVVFLSFYLTLPGSKITIYSAESIEVEEIDNLENFVLENNLNFKFFNNELSRNSIAKIKNTDTFAYVMQIFNGIGETGFDIIELKVVLMSNAEFEFYTSYSTLTNSILINNIDIQYMILNGVSSVRLYAKFDFEDKGYFLEIQTYDSGTAVLEKYINQLLN